MSHIPAAGEPSAITKRLAPQFGYLSYRGTAASGGESGAGPILHIAGGHASSLLLAATSPHSYFHAYGMLHEPAVGNRLRGVRYLFARSRSKQEQLVGFNCVD